MSPIHLNSSDTGLKIYRQGEKLANDDLKVEPGEIEREEQDRWDDEDEEEDKLDAEKEEDEEDVYSDDMSAHPI